MKKTKRVKSKKPELTEAEIKILLQKAGFTFVIDKKSPAFGRPKKDLHQGETVVITEDGRKIIIK